MSDILLYANIAVSWGLLVLIWLVQLIVYPSFYRIPAESFAGYHRWYTKRIAAIVLPLMISELGLSAGWVLVDNFSPASVLSGVMVCTVWLSTFGLQVPIHNRLKSVKDEMLIRRLVMTNWIRTGAWSVKSLIISITTLSSMG